MRYFLIIFSLIWVILLAGKSDKPDHHFTNSFNLKCDTISTQLEDMMHSAPSLPQYRDLRRRFKEVEFLVAFMDHEFYNKKLNGAPLPKLEQNVTELKVIQPSGLQVLDELIADPVRSTDEWLSTLKKFQSSWKEFRTIYRYQSMPTDFIAQAVQLQLIRIYTMGITGFDAPGTLLSMSDCAHSFQGMRDLLAELDEPFNEALINEMDLNYQLFVHSLFDTFDRLRYYTDYWQLLYSHWVQYVQQNQWSTWESSVTPVPVNPNATDLFSVDFFNRRAFLDFDPNEYTQTTINLGRQLFFDPGLSSTGTMSCATCHKPEKGFSDGLPKSKSLSGGHLDRNAPGLMNSVLAGSFFYDLRAEHLSQQFEHVITNQDEFNTTLLTIFSYLEGGDYRDRFVSAFPNHAANPVNPYTFKTALSAYLHSLTGYNSPFDRFMRHESAKLDKDVIAGYNLFMGKAACATCHFPPTFSGLLPPLFDDSESEVLGVPKDEKYTAIDPDMGRYSLSRIKEAVDFYKHSFKTVSVRNVSKTAPYMHNGVFDDLKDVVEFYNNGGGLGHQLDVPYQTLAGDSLDLSKKEQKQLIRFMEALEEPEMR